MGGNMSKKDDPQKRLARKAIVHHVIAAAKSAKKSAKTVLNSNRTLPRAVEIEPRQSDSLALRALKKERLHLLDEIKHQEVLSQDHPTTGNHMADDASDVAEQAKTLALRRHLEGMLKEVERAMVRAEKGTYGLCERCGRAISEERLRAMPWVTLCIDDAKSLEPRARAAA